MSFESDFNEFLGETVVVTAFSTYSTDGYARPSFATSASTYKARIVQKPQLVKAADGQDVISTHQVYVATTTAIGVQDKFSVNGTTERILAVARYPDEDGATHHQKVFLG